MWLSGDAYSLQCGQFVSSENVARSRKLSNGCCAGPVNLRPVEEAGRSVKSRFCDSKRREAQRHYLS